MWRDCGKGYGVSESILGYYIVARAVGITLWIYIHRKYECGIQRQFTCGACCRFIRLVDIMRVHRTGHRVALHYLEEGFPGSNQQLSVTFYRDSRGETK